MRMKIDKKIELALSFEATKEVWRKQYDSEEWKFCSKLNAQIFGKEFNRRARCECIEDFFLLLKHQNKKQLIAMAQKKYKLKPDTVIQLHDRPEAITDASPDEECIALLALNPKFIKDFEEAPATWKDDVKKHNEALKKEAEAKKAVKEKKPEAAKSPAAPKADETPKEEGKPTTSPAAAAETPESEDLV